MLIGALASPAYASQCPALMKNIDDALATAKVDDATKTKIMALYDKGEAEHKAGKHGASVADLQAALKLLGM
ncbi:MAG: hypothetical protein HY245_09515 [Rhizobiales bacterium]|nr:hypothetical protein [Hyphomicrobiales bacterium]MBI3673639.1 hypothetical protein [Hyphomicrobiales bacterium]